MNGSVLVTGASGVLGRAIVLALSTAGVAVRQGVRNPEKATRGTESVRLDYADPATFSSAMNGARGLVLMAPPLDGEAAAKLGPVVSQAKNSEIEHIVFISAFGVNHNEQAPLRLVEHMVIDSGVSYTILRPNFFMENFSEGSVAGSIVAQNGIFVAAGDGKTSFISVHDIATSVAAAFSAPLTNKEFDLTGPEALDHIEVAKIVADVSGRPVIYHSLTEEQMSSGARAAGLPEPMVGYLGMLYGVVRAGYAAGVTTDVETVTGKKAPLSGSLLSARHQRGGIKMQNTFLAMAMLTAGALGSASAATCDRGCLLDQAKQFNANILAHTPEKIPLATGAKIFENTKAVTLTESRWSTIRQIRSQGVYADAVKGNVIEHVAAEKADGKIVYIGTRLKVADGKISEVEINFDDRPNVNAKNLIPYDPVFNTIVPPEERATREQLERIITSYFQGLTDHQPIEADYDVRCDRYHSGNRVTHNARNAVENSGDVGCYESNLGPKPWGPATEIRIGLIDPERGIVIGYAILQYANNRQMQINEIFKILDGRVRLVDNIGLMGSGITTSGFNQ